MQVTARSLAIAMLATGALSRDVPQNVRDFYNDVKGGKCSGGEVLQDGFYSQSGGPRSFAYCQDSCNSAIYIHGPSSDFANMDIDCDGLQSGGDGRCASSYDTQAQTSFSDLVQKYSKEANNYASDLNANYASFVVFGNQGKSYGYTNFNPQDFGIQPLSVMAVVCGDKLVYGVWGDTNGDDGIPIVGESSISLATACYGHDVNGNAGHEQNDVMYIAFPGSEEDTVEKNAAWNAKSFEEFEASIASVGDRLIKTL